MKPSEEVPGRPAAGAGEDEAFNGPSFSAIETGPDGPVFAGGIWGVDVAEDEDVCLRVLSGGEMMFFLRGYPRPKGSRFGSQGILLTKLVRKEEQLSVLPFEFGS